MKMTKILLASLALLSFQSAVAEILNGDNKSSIIELDNQHIRVCQRQLFVTASKDVYPVILLYAKNDSLSNLFMPTYEDVANSLHSQRQFFRYDAGSANPKVTDECLGLDSTLMVPTVMVAYKFIDDETLSNPLRAVGGVKWDKMHQQPVSISKMELLNIITMPTSQQSLQTVVHRLNP